MGGGGSSGLLRTGSGAPLGTSGGGELEGGEAPDVVEVNGGHGEHGEPGEAAGVAAMVGPSDENGDEGGEDELSGDEKAMCYEPGEDGVGLGDAEDEGGGREAHVGDAEKDVDAGDQNCARETLRHFHCKPLVRDDFGGAGVPQVGRRAVLPHNYGHQSMCCRYAVSAGAGGFPADGVAAGSVGSTSGGGEARAPDTGDGRERRWV